MKGGSGLNEGSFLNGSSVFNKDNVLVEGSVLNWDSVLNGGSVLKWGCVFSSLKSQVVYSKQPKLGLTQEFVVDCAHALWVVHSIKRLVSLMLLKWFLSDSFIYFMYRMFNEKF